jgi:hypothetical protein
MLARPSDSNHFLLNGIYPLILYVSQETNYINGVTFKGNALFSLLHGSVFILYRGQVSDLDKNPYTFPYKRDPERVSVNFNENTIE